MGMTRKTECPGCKRQRVIVGDLHIGMVCYGTVDRAALHHRINVPLCRSCLKFVKSGQVHLVSQGAQRRLTLKQLAAQDKREARAAERQKQAALRGIE